MRGHARPRLCPEVLDDDLLDVAELLAERLQREQGVDPVLARLSDPDQDPARERDLELAREPDRLEPESCRARPSAARPSPRASRPSSRA
jgi:hypothetical protein